MSLNGGQFNKQNHVKIRRLSWQTQNKGVQAQIKIQNLHQLVAIVLLQKIAHLFKVISTGVLHKEANLNQRKNSA